MKKRSILIAVLMGLYCIANCQDSSTAPAFKLKNNYLKIAKSQRTVAFILLGAGIAAIGSVSSGNASFNTTSTVGVLGAAAILGSIPLFIAAHRNKRKATAAATSFDFKSGWEQSFAKRKPAYFPTLSLTMTL